MIVIRLNGIVQLNCNKIIQDWNWSAGLFVSDSEAVALVLEIRKTR